MLQVRFHGRGGQGVVTAAEMLSVAAFHDGMHSQAFPSFGSERTGAPVVAFCKIDDEPIRSHEPVRTPDVLIIQDPTLLHQMDVFNGVAVEGFVIINSARPVEALGLGDVIAWFDPHRIVSLPASEIAREALGRPLPNAVLLGAFAAVTGAVSLPSVLRAIEARFGDEAARGNMAGAVQGFEHVRTHSGAKAGAGTA